MTDLPAEQMMPRVCGLDISLTATGIADNMGHLITVGQDGITKMPLLQRGTALCDLAEEITARVWDAQLVVIEQAAFSKTYGGSSERAGLWWEVVRILREGSVPLAEVTTGSLKKYATGNGSAGKGQVIDAVARRLPLFVTNGDNNLADAAVLAAMGADHLGFPLAVMPMTHRAALDAVAWPEGTA